MEITMSKLMGILLIILFGCGGLLAVGTIYGIIDLVMMAIGFKDWKLYTDKNIPIMKFSAFESFQRISPNLWEVCDNGYYVSLTKEGYFADEHGRNRYEHEKHIFRFSYLDYKKLKRWIKNEDKMKAKLKDRIQEESNIKEIAAMLAIMQQEINNLNDNNNAKMKKASEEIIACLNNRER